VPPATDDGTIGADRRLAFGPVVEVGAGTGTATRMARRRLRGRGR
jgi:hypothetical protein